MWSTRKTRFQTASQLEISGDDENTGNLVSDWGIGFFATLWQTFQDQITTNIVWPTRPERQEPDGGRDYD
jgi:hypothetical protein